RICIWSGRWRIIPVLLVLVISQIPLPYIFKPYNIEIMFPCFMVGIYLKRHLSWFIDNAKQLIVGFGLLFGVMILFWNASFWESVGFLAGLQSGVFDTDLLLRLIYVRSFKLLIGISASIVLILLFNQWFDQSKTGDSKLLMVAQNWGQYTMAVYVLQTFILELVMANVLNFDSMNFYLFNFVVVPILSLFLLWLCVTIAKIMGKSRVLSALMFGSGS
ncbi:MAG: hypothetical protein IIU62_00200, partial [Alistipes sp.]|nr:hypothetical protein [Alistipes sp.]